MDLINIKVTFDLDFDLGSKKYRQKLIPEVRFVRKDGIAHETLLFKKNMICLLRVWPCWILANCKSSPKCPAWQLSQISSVISWEPKTIKKKLVRSMIARFTMYGYMVATGLKPEGGILCEDLHSSAELQ